MSTMDFIIVITGVVSMLYELVFILFDEYMHIQTQKVIADIEAKVPPDGFAVALIASNFVYMVFATLALTKGPFAYGGLILMFTLAPKHFKESRSFRLLDAVVCLITICLYLIYVCKKYYI